jgi:c-di-GMP-binding flagellar brake protein YcgR
VEIEAFRIASPSTGQIMILVALAVIVGLAFLIASRRMARGGRRIGRPAGEGWHNFYQISKVRGLSKNETEVLRKLVISQGLTKPTLIFTSTTILDSCIQRAIRRLSLQEIRGESKDDIINMYYRLRNKISRGKKGRGVASSRAIPPGAKLRLGVQNYGYYTVSVVRNEHDYLGVSIPVLPPGKIIPWNRKKVRCSYFRENDAVYVFETKVTDVIITNALQIICLRHTEKITRIQKRLYPRQNVRLPVFYSKLRVTEEGGKKKAVVDRKETHWGTVIDVSVGGLSIETTVPFDRNNYLRVEFELREEYKVVGFGKVRRIERNAVRKTWIMHIQFTKIDKKHRNEIFAVLYNYQTI